MKRTILAASLIAALAISCKKKDKPFAISKETVSGSYKFTGLLSGNVNVYDNPDASKNVVPACAKDDIHELKIDETYRITDLGVTCDPSGTETGTWNFINSTKLKFNDENITIKSFDGKTLIMLSEDSSVQYQITFTKQ